MSLLGQVGFFVVSLPVVVQVDRLVVAGGGAGGSGSVGSFGGAGGAGGYRADTAVNMYAGIPYIVVVGSGGVYNNTTNGTGTAGGDSEFDNITSTGGGIGANGTTSAGNGGSGGAGTFAFPTHGSGNTPSTSPAQGYDGGDWVSGGGSHAGGGGGGAAAGNVAGPGVSNSISGSAVTYATGGQYTITPTASTGQGGAGGRTVADGGPVGNSGADGVVIIRYSDTYPAAAITTGSPSITVSGGWRVYKWTSTGTWSITL